MIYSYCRQGEKTSGHTRRYIMKVINYGKMNDASLYALNVEGRLVPMKKIDLRHEKPDVKINYDSGVYPGITDIEKYICNQVMLNYPEVL
jgi:hypothetical protein